LNLNLSADEVLTTTRAVRKRLDFDRPVEAEIIKECLEIALQSPSGSNSQNWLFLVVTDEAKRRALADLYRQSFDSIYRNSDLAASVAYSGDDAARLATQQRVMNSAGYMSDNFHRAPVMLIPCLPMKLDGESAMMASSMLGSILPATWSFMLAARERGLGTSWTTLHLVFEEQAAEILGIPFDEVTQVALIPVAYTKGTNFKPAPREPAESVTYWNTWGEKS
jgi:nitroreductase